MEMMIVWESEDSEVKCVRGRMETVTWWSV